MTDQSWTLSRKIGFRFSFIFILSFILFKNNGAFSLLGYLTQFLTTPMRQLCHWFAIHILNYQYDYAVYTNGSGDTSYDWVSLAVFLVVAVLGTLVWSVLDRDRKSYNTCYYWLTAITRYYIAFMLINYGVVKLTHSQMPPPGLGRLMQPLGEFSPMGLAWTYFGYSKGYNIFVGIVEVLAGLLLFRRTMVLGALITTAVSINIMATNYFFDVPVKILSTALFLLSLYLLLPYIRTLFNLLVRGRLGQLQLLERPIYTRSWKNKLMIGLKVMILLVFVAQQVTGLLNRHKLIDHYFKKSAFYGIYRIDDDNTERKSIPKDWMFIVFEYEGYESVRDKYYKKIAITPTIDVGNKTISLNNYTFDYSVDDNGDVFLKKVFDSRTEVIKLVKQKPEDFELRKRGFNWIQEYPYNR
ncbi:DoxX family protein [Sphingobacterium faecale]|uniref:DoxX family protein n=1 Tax=Sphingobacterium faecale TaxID=2803775 RepID=A0ABS1RBT6_9SPHI|nr:DoxX family protein [Sphingobacterium faecale]MBL1411311.1 DoxX family protein [Sphingobacterium faecale]